MAINIGINGFGRIGRLVFRSAINNNEFNVVCINDLLDVNHLAYLLKYDSVHGKLANQVSSTDKSISIDGNEIACFSERDPSNLPWKELDVDLVFECTGFFASKDGSQKHLDAGAKRVLISAPATGVDKTIVYGVNHTSLTKDDLVISNASCTTNCLAPLAKVINEKFGITNGLANTIHAYTTAGWQKAWQQVACIMKQITNLVIGFSSSTACGKNRFAFLCMCMAALLWYFGG